MCFRVKDRAVHLVSFLTGKDPAKRGDSCHCLSHSYLIRERGTFDLVLVRRGLILIR